MSYICLSCGGTKQTKHRRFLEKGQAHCADCFHTLVKRTKTQILKAAQVQKFKANVLKLCTEANFSISHEDGHGAFLVIPLDKTGHHEKWFNAARYEEE